MAPFSSQPIFVLNEPRNPKNIGASARAIANFGFRRLAVVNPYAKAWRETRAAVHGADVVRRAKKYASLPDALGASQLVIGTSGVVRRNADVRWIGLEEMREHVHASLSQRKNVAVLFGSERSGLSNDDLAFCHYVVRVPTSASCPSMNLSQAVAVVCCAIRFEQALEAAPASMGTALSVERLERLVHHGFDAWAAAGLLKGRSDNDSHTRLRQAFYRWNVSDVDAAMLHALFRWVLKKTGVKKPTPH